MTTPAFYSGVPDQPTPGQNGVIPLRAWPGCFTPYSGEHRGAAAYLVGWNTEHERVYLAADSKLAVAYAKTIKPQPRVVRVALDQLCADAVDALYATP